MALGVVSDRLRGIPGVDAEDDESIRPVRRVRGRDSGGLLLAVGQAVFQKMIQIGRPAESARATGAPSRSVSASGESGAWALPRAIWPICMPGSALPMT